MTFDEEHAYQIMVMGKIDGKKIDGKKIDGKKIDGKDVKLIRTGLYLFLIFVIQQSASKIIILRQSQLLADVAPHRAHV